MTERTAIEFPVWRWLQTSRAAFRVGWTALRNLSGDDAYERYLAHRRSHDACDRGAPLDRAAFFRAEQTRKWEGVKRCC